MKRLFVFTLFLTFVFLTNLTFGQEKLHNFIDMDFKTLGEYGKSGGTVIVPMVQIESHGVHLPVGTDLYCSMAIAKQTAEKCDAIVGVPITFGNCVPFSSWPGYVMIDTPTLNSLVKQYLKSLEEQGFKKVVFIIMHGGDNFYGVKLAIDEYYKDNQNMSIAVTFADLMLGPEGLKLLRSKPGVDVDTSIMLKIKPELVHMDKLETAEQNKPQPETKARAIRYERGKDLAYYRPDNYRNVSNSTADLGVQFMTILSDNLAELINSLD